MVVLQSMPVRITSPVVWLEAPEWLMPEEAAYLSGYDLETLAWMVQDGAVDTRRDGDGWLIEKESLLEFREALLDVLCWYRG